ATNAERKVGPTGTASINDRTSAYDGWNRYWKPTCTTRPAARAASASAYPSAASATNGFSQYTCSPAASASRTSATWVLGGVAKMTASRRPLAYNSAALAKPGTSRRAAAFSRTLSTTSQIATSSYSGIDAAAK